MINSIQVGRGLAALAVVLHHATLGSKDFHGEIAFNGFFAAGKLGVDFFFHTFRFYYLLYSPPRFS